MQGTPRMAPQHEQDSAQYALPDFSLYKLSAREQDWVARVFANLKSMPAKRKPDDLSDQGATIAESYGKQRPCNAQFLEKLISQLEIIWVELLAWPKQHPVRVQQRLVKIIDEICRLLREPALFPSQHICEAFLNYARFLIKSVFESFQKQLALMRLKNKIILKRTRPGCFELFKSRVHKIRANTVTWNDVVNNTHVDVRLFEYRARQPGSVTQFIPHSAAVIWNEWLKDLRKILDSHERDEIPYQQFQYTDERKRIWPPRTPANSPIWQKLRESGYEDLDEICKANERTANHQASFLNSHGLFGKFPYKQRNIYHDLYFKFDDMNSLWQLSEGLARIDKIQRWESVADEPIIPGFCLTRTTYQTEKRQTN